MVQMRCPECGYLQTMSEERFLTISEDFLNCPHCHARVPREWQPKGNDSIPEEASHKIMAFSSRIINGSEIAREMVTALETLVRQYGAGESADKALGVGYARLGEFKRAEEFLRKAKQQYPEDVEILRSFQQVALEQEKFEEAEEAGSILLGLAEEHLVDADVARLIFSLVVLNRLQEAQELMDTHPWINPKESIVKKARKKIVQAQAPKSNKWFMKKDKIAGLFRNLGKSTKAYDNATATYSNYSDILNHDESIDGLPESGAVSVNMDREPVSVGFRTPTLMEYWIYSQSTAVPPWEDVLEAMEGLITRRNERERSLDFIQQHIETKSLTMDYVLKKEVGQLFEYPKELLSENGRDLAEEEIENVMDAAMIVRVRFTPKEDVGLGGFSSIVRFVEALRSLANGVIQDAVSHVLWGVDPWKIATQNPLKDFMETQIKLEALDENGKVWIHTHGMQKIGLMDLEMDGIPSHLALAGRKFIIAIADQLFRSRHKSDIPDFGMLPGAPYGFHVVPTPLEDESHFPVGSLLIFPYMENLDFRNPSTLERVLSRYSSETITNPYGKVSSHGNKPETSPDRKPSRKEEELRERILDAHYRAQSDLKNFKSSFRNSTDSDRQVHAIKACFPSGDGQLEWMWVSVKSWDEDLLEGYLENTPVAGANLKHGSIVKLTEQQIFDWVIMEEDRIILGGYTDKLVA
jgi:uncharacterized protein YegJ (DUF2314 family)